MAGRADIVVSAGQPRPKVKEAPACGAGASLIAGSDSENRLHSILMVSAYAIIKMTAGFRHSLLTIRSLHARPLGRCATGKDCYVCPFSSDRGISAATACVRNSTAVSRRNISQRTWLRSRRLSFVPCSCRLVRPGTGFLLPINQDVLPTMCLCCSRLTTPRIEYRQVGRPIHLLEAAGAMLAARRGFQ